MYSIIIFLVNKASIFFFFCLSHFRLTECMNKEYNNIKKKRTQKLDWKMNDLCAVLIKKYGNWYRGKIVNIDKTNKIVTVSLKFYNIEVLYF